jgi:hypothetical protein
VRAPLPCRYPSHIHGLVSFLLFCSQDYEAAANFIGTFFELEAKLSKGGHGHQLAPDDGEDTQRQVRQEERSGGTLAREKRKGQRNHDV